MNNTMTIKINNKKAIKILHDLEELNLIEVIRDEVTLSTGKISEKYRGSLSKESGQELNQHIKQMRNEWHNTF